MKVEANLETMYKITVGDNGMCMGQYYSEDDWVDLYYNNDLKQIAEELSIKYINGFPTRKFYFEEVEVLIYDGNKYDQRIIRELNQYRQEDDTLKKEYAEFMCYWTELGPDRKKMIEVQKLKDERQEKLSKIKREEERKNKELTEYLKLKEKFENG